MGIYIHGSGHYLFRFLAVVYHMSLCCKAHTLGVHGKKGEKYTPAALRLTFFLLFFFFEEKKN